MILTLAAALALQAAPIDPPAGALCVQSSYGENNKMTYVIPASRVSAFQSRADARGRNFEIIACPTAWTPASTQAFCDAVEGFSDNLKSAMTEIYAISPDEMCEAAQEVDALQADR